jgi:hypothetical protein
MFIDIECEKLLHNWDLTFLSHTWDGTYLCFPCLTMVGT